MILKGKRHTCTYTQAHAPTYTQAHTQAHAHTHLHTHTDTYTYTQAFTYRHMHAHTGMQRGTRAHMHTHTEKRTCTQAFRKFIEVTTSRLTFFQYKFRIKLCKLCHFANDGNKLLNCKQICGILYFNGSNLLVSPEHRIGKSSLSKII